MESRAWLCASILAVLFTHGYGYATYADFPGPYCATRPDPCCIKRDDDCSVPIFGTRCYCDEFCIRHNSDDCCPDYRPVCLGDDIPSAPILQCSYKGTNIPPGESVSDNCNKCTCEAPTINGKVEGEIICEEDDCLLEDTIIDSVNRDHHRLGWTVSNYSVFWGQKLDYGLTKRLGTLKSKASVLNMRPVKILKFSDLPKSFHSTEKWSSMIGGITDQGWCGSSWAISTAAVASDRLHILSRGLEMIDFSAQNLLSCNSRHQQGCNGGHLDAVWQYIRKVGVVDAQCYPYNTAHPTDKGCPVKPRGKPKTFKNFGCEAPDNVIRRTLYTAAPSYRLNNETDIMQEIFDSGPVQSTMQVHRDFFAYRRGVYRLSAYSNSPKIGYHSVRIVGWGEEHNGYDVTKFWVVANSWGTDWGEDGYFRILKGTNECDIENFVLGAWPKTSETKYDNSVIIGPRQ